MENIKKAGAFLGNLVLGALGIIISVGFGLLLAGIFLHVVKFSLDGYGLWTS
jgi:hypothetical protein